MKELSHLVRSQTIFANCIATLILEAAKLGYLASVKEWLRTEDQQKIYLQQKKTKTLNSRHLVGCAVDIVFFKDGVIVNSFHDLRPIVDIWYSLNPACVWGGDWDRSGKQATFYDAYHFELSSKF